MRSRWKLTTIALLLAAGAAFHFGTPVRAQVGTPNNALLEGAALGANPRLRTFGLDTNVTLDILTQGNGNIVLNPGGTGIINLDGPVTLSGSITQANPVTDNVTVFAAIKNCQDSLLATPLIPVRLATNDWALARTAAGAETHNITCSIPLPWRSTALKGARLDSFSIIQQVTVVDLTSNTFNDLATVTYVDNVANAVADYGGVVTITMPTVVQANPYVTAATIGTPAFMTTAATAVNIDFTVVMANTGVYRLYGIAATFSTVSF